MIKKIKLFIILSKIFKVKYFKYILGIHKINYIALFPILFGLSFLVSLFSNGYIENYNYVYPLNIYPFLIIYSILHTSYIVTILIKVTIGNYNNFIKLYENIDKLNTLYRYKDKDNYGCLYFEDITDDARFDIYLTAILASFYREDRTRIKVESKLVRQIKLAVIEYNL